MKQFDAFDKVLVKSRRTNEWFPDIYQREYNGEHYVLGTDHGYNDNEIKKYKVITEFLLLLRKKLAKKKNNKPIVESIPYDKDLLW